MYHSSEEDRILKKALTLLEQERLSELPDDSQLDEVTFSPSFEKKMEKMISTQKHSVRNFFFGYQSIGHCVASFALAFLLLCGTAFGVKAAADPNFLITVYEKFSSLFFSHSTSQIDIEPCYPTFLPEGFTLHTESTTSYDHYTKYTNITNKWVTLTQSIVDNDQYFIDTESSVMTSLLIQGYSAAYVKTTNQQYLLWKTSTYTYMVCGNISEENLIAIAESIPLK